MTKPPETTFRFALKAGDMFFSTKMGWVWDLIDADLWDRYAEPEALLEKLAGRNPDTLNLMSVVCFMFEET